MELRATRATKATISQHGGANPVFRYGIVEAGWEEGEECFELHQNQKIFPGGNYDDDDDDLSIWYLGNIKID